MVDEHDGYKSRGDIGDIERELLLVEVKLLSDVLCGCW